MRGKSTGKYSCVILLVEWVDLGALTCPTSSNAITTRAAPNFLTMLAFAIKSSSPSFKLMELTIHFPWEHLRPASMTEKLLESIQRGSYE